jgi:hypothetical protein
LVKTSSFGDGKSLSADIPNSKVRDPLNPMSPSKHRKSGKVVAGDDHGQARQETVRMAELYQTLYQILYRYEIIYRLFQVQVEDKIQTRAWSIVQEIFWPTAAETVSLKYQSTQGIDKARSLIKEYPKVCF